MNDVNVVFSVDWYNVLHIEIVQITNEISTFLSKAYP